MKALILAAGYATRLYPLTLDTPKPLLVINKIPMIERIIEKILEIKAIDEIFIISNDKFFEKFSKWLQNYRHKDLIILVNDGTKSDESKLGAVGDINFTLNQYNIKEDILVIGADNLFEFSLNDVYDSFIKKGDTVILRDLGDLSLMSRYSVVDINKENKIISFVEKPNEPVSTLTSICVYFYKNDTLPLFKKYINEKRNPDAPGYFVQWLYKEKSVFGFIADGIWYDIGDIKSLNEADELYKRMKK